MAIGANPLGGTFVRRAENDQQEEERQHHFRDKAGWHGILAVRVVPESVGGESASRGKARLPAGDDREHPRPGHRSGNLGRDVRQQALIP